MKAALTVVGTPFALVLLIGGAMGEPVPTAMGESATVPYPAVLPPAPTPFNGRSAGCTVPDPTGTGGCVTPATAWLLSQVAQAFGQLPTSCWDEHAWNPSSDHPRGKGCDVTFGELGTFPGPADVDRGWLLSHWLQANADALRVKYLIWQGLTWSIGDDAEWRPYTGGGVYDPTDPTGGHYDHIHVSTST